MDRFNAFGLMNSEMAGPVDLMKPGKDRRRIYATSFPYRQMMEMNITTAKGGQRNRPCLIKSVILDIHIHYMWFQSV
tara:strand:+ start:390 stop:620 length:231 start_codon:yes stop_codon:yes gene_type:complete